MKCSCKQATRSQYHCAYYLHCFVLHTFSYIWCRIVLTFHSESIIKRKCLREHICRRIDNPTEFELKNEKTKLRQRIHIPMSKQSKAKWFMSIILWECTFVDSENWFQKIRSLYARRIFSQKNYWDDQSLSCMECILRHKTLDGTVHPNAPIQKLRRFSALQNIAFGRCLSAQLQLRNETRSHWKEYTNTQHQRD